MRWYFNRLSVYPLICKKNNKTLIFKLAKLSFCTKAKTVGIMKVLNVAEKNDAAKNIASILGRGNCTRRDGLSVYNKIYEFKVDLWNQNCQMIMTSVSGHLLGFEFVEPYRKWLGCHPLSLFDAPVVKKCSEENYIKIKQTIEREIKKCNALIIWTDCDREGENIGFEIIQVCQAIKPNIQVYRAKFSEITGTSIFRALQTLEAPNKAVSDAVDVRSELDLRIGAAFTRFQTLRLQKVFPRSLAEMLISYGSCQFPTLGFVVERFLAIERFKPEPYWKIKVMDNRGNTNVEFRWARVRLFEELPCQVLLEICLENQNATVEKITRKPKSKWRPVPLDTIELEKQGSRKLRLNAKETMKIAERLYTQGFISYPRTETNIFPKELNLASLVTHQANDPTWGNFAQRLLDEGITPRQGKKSDMAHPPIHPTKYTNSLQGNEAKVYEFIVRHFLACLSKNAEGHETIVDIDIAGEKFTANGLHVIAKNYLEIYIYEKWNDKEIHSYQEGEIFKPTCIDLVKEETSPPNLLTEADLIALMDKHGIGTDATHAEHIETIKSRQYVGLMDGQHLMPGKLGIGLVMGYDDMGFHMSKPNLRAELENDLKLICDGQKNPKEVLQNQINKYRELFKVALERANLIDNALATYLDEQPLQAEQMQNEYPREQVPILKCPKCKNNMVLKDRKENRGKFIGCVAFPTCNNAIWLPSSVEEVTVLDETCNQCAGNKRKLKFKLKRNAFPFLGTSYTSCIGGCDVNLNEMFGIRDDSVKERRTAINVDSGYDGSGSSVSTSSSNRPSNPISGSSGLSTLNRNTERSSTQNRQQQNLSGISRSTQNSGFHTSVPDQNRSEIRRIPLINSREREGNNRTNEHGFNNANRNTSTQDQNNDRVWGNIDNNSDIICNCHENAIQLTVRKEGPNQGRLFYKCAKPQGTGCNFFLWASDSTSSQSSVASRSSNQVTTTNTSNSRGQHNQYLQPHRDNYGNTQNSNISASAELTCNCNQPAKILITQKEGPNKGRRFYTCANGPSGCKFFKWVDEIVENVNVDWDSIQTQNQQHRGSRGVKRSRGVRKCGICGVAGHTRTTCPQNVMD